MGAFREAYTRELDAAVTAFGCCALLLDVQVTELATRGLDDPGLVRDRVVPARMSQCLFQLGFGNARIVRSMQCSSLVGETYGCLRRWRLVS